MDAVSEGREEGRSGRCLRREGRGSQWALSQKVGKRVAVGAVSEGREEGCSGRCLRREGRGSGETRGERALFQNEEKMAG